MNGPTSQPSQRAVQALFRTLVAGLAGPPVHANRCGDMLPDFVSTPGDCHRNADRYAAQNASAVPVRGWLYEPAAEGVHRFVAHSIVRTAVDELIDVTLGAADPELRFLAHPGLDDDFFAFLRCPYAFTELTQVNVGLDITDYATLAASAIADADGSV